MTICWHHNTPQGCPYGDRCRFEHVDEGDDSSDDSSDDELAFTERQRKLNVFCVVCNSRCFPETSNHCTNQWRSHWINWHNVRCRECDLDLDPYVIDYPDDWPAGRRGYPYLWLQECPNCERRFRCGKGGQYGVLF